MLKYLIFSILMIFVLNLFATGEWHPEITARPRTLMANNELSIINSRITRAPYTEMLAKVYTWSDWSYDAQNSERNKAVVARSAAFRYLISSDTLYAAKAKDYLLNRLQEEPSSIPLERIDNLIWTSETVYLASITYDFLQTHSYLDGTDDVQIRDNIAELAGVLYYACTATFDPIWGFFTYFDGEETNYGAKIGAALGMCALSLNNYSSDTTKYQPSAWINLSMHLLNDIYNSYQVDADGGWAEGPNYYAFAAKNIVPFAIGHNKFVNGNTENYGEDYLPPLIYNDHFQKNLQWTGKIRKPGGRSPNFEDTFLNTYGVNGLAGEALAEAGLSQASREEVWHFINTNPAYYTGDNNSLLAVETICLFDDSIFPQMPAAPASQYLPHAGQLILRDDWENENIYLLMLAQHGVARTGGHAHEHVDNLSFILSAYQKDLIIDSGYISYTQHGLVNNAAAHNLILVNDAGPSGALDAPPISQGVDAHLIDYYFGDDMATGSATTSYGGADITRRIVMCDSIFFIYDRVNGGNSNNYKLLLHGNGGGDTANAHAISGAKSTYTVGNIQLDCLINANQSISIYSQDVPHETHYDHYENHALTVAEVASARDVNFITILYPHAVSDSTWDYQHLREAGNALSIFEKTKTYWTGSKGADSLATYSHNGKTITSDASSVFFVEADGPQQLFMEGGRSFYYQDNLLVAADSSLQLEISWTDSSITGHASAYTQLQVYTTIRPQTLNGSTEFVYENNYLYFDVFEGTEFSIKGDIQIGLPAYLNPHFVYANNSLTLTWENHPDAISYVVESAAVETGSCAVLTSTTATSIVLDTSADKMFYRIKYIKENR